MYKASFTVTVNVYNPGYETISYITANNTAPYLVPPPEFAEFFAGDEFNYKLGYTVDNELDNVSVRVELGDFSSVG